MRSIGDEVVEFLVADEFVSAFVYFVEYVLCFVLQDGFFDDLHDLAELSDVESIPLFGVELLEYFFDVEVVGLDDVFELANDAVELLVHGPLQLFLLLPLLSFDSLLPFIIFLFSVKFLLLFFEFLLFDNNFLLIFFFLQLPLQRLFGLQFLLF